MTSPCRCLRVIGASLLVCGLVAMGVPATAAAQSTEMPDADAGSAAEPAHISFVDGAAVLERDGQTDNTPSNMPLLAGDRVRTQTGRVEILFADGGTLHLDANTTVDFQSDELVRLLDGRIRLAIPGPNRAVSYRIDAASASAQIAQPGEYRVAVLHGAREAEVELAVIRGAAELVNDEGRTPLRAGERAYARANTAPSYAYVFNSASWDAFDRWSEARRDERLGVSAEYLPDQVRPYASSFDRYGSWRYDASYGNVWYPSVSAQWRPYYYGRWVTLRPYGWTWVGSDPWAWPTHHYGRWGVSAGLWFWIPGRSWAPAWVSWAYAPGYVSWCPLGWNNRAIFGINVNVYNRGYDPWRAWTVVPQRHFGVGYVNARYGAGNTFDARTRGSFVPRNSAPDMRGYAVPRASAPIRVAGTGGGRRVNSPVYTNLERGASRVGDAPSRVMVEPSRRSVAGAPRADAPGAGAERSRAVPRGAPMNGGSVPDATADPRTRSAAGIQPRDGSGAYAAPDRRAVPREGDTQSGQSRLNVPGGAGGYAAPDRRAVPRGGNVDGVAPSQRPYDSVGSGRDPVAGRPAPRSTDNPVYRAVPRSTDNPVYRADPAPRATDNPVYRPNPAPRSTDNPVYRVDPYGRRAPEQAGAPAARSMRGGVEDRGLGGGVRAVPREAPGSPRSAPSPQYRQGPTGPPAAPDRGPWGGVPREAPDSPRASPPQYRQSPMGPAPERRMPAAERAPERPSGPPAGAARPRSGGQPSSGTAGRRPGGGR